MATEERGEGQSSKATQFDRHANGVRLLLAGDVEGAIAAFGEAFGLDPDSSHAALAYRRRAEVYRQLGKEQEAEADAKAAEAIQGASSPATEQTAAEGGVVTETGRLDKAAEEYRARPQETAGRHVQMVEDAQGDLIDIRYACSELCANDLGFPQSSAWLGGMETDDDVYCENCGNLMWEGLFRARSTGVLQWKAIAVGGIGGVVAGVIAGLAIAAAGVTLYEFGNNLALGAATVLGPLFVAGVIASVMVREKEVENGLAGGIAAVAIFIVFSAAVGANLGAIGFVLLLVFGVVFGALGGVVGGLLRNIR